MSRYQGRLAVAAAVLGTVAGCASPAGEPAQPRIEPTRVVEPTGAADSVESAEAAAAGCTRQWADLVGAAAGRGTTGGPAVVPPGFDGPVPVLLCVYRVPADRQRTAVPAGDFVSGRYLGDEQWAGVRREVESAGPAAVCAAPASRFAVVHFGAGQLLAELDGCRRLLATAADGTETIRQASPALVALLAAE